MPIPHVSFEDGLDERWAISNDDFAYGLDDIGLPEPAVEQTSVHFNWPRGYVGSTIGDSLLDRFMFTVPGFSHRTVKMMGFAPHQAKFKYKVAVDADPDETPQLLRDSLLHDHHDQARKIRQLNAGDLVGLLLANQLLYVVNRVSKEDQTVPRRNEGEIKAYIGACASLGTRSPWSGVVRAR